MKQRITYCGDGWYCIEQREGDVWTTSRNWQYDQLGDVQQELVDSYREIVRHPLEGYWIEF